jgi:FtsP/CotA-like multicopper oxidase with cupredoxin domain
MRNRAHRHSRRTLTLAATTVVVLTAGAVGAWGGRLVNNHRPATATAPTRQAPVWQAGGHRTVITAARPTRHGSKPAAKPAVKAAVRPHRAKAAVRPHRAKATANSTRALAAAPPPVDLCAKAGTADLGAGVTVPIWGFALLGGAASCDDPLVVATIPGPQLDVNAGDALTVNITNAVPGHTLSFEVPGVDVGGTVDVPYLGTATLTLSAPEGTYLYDSAGDAGRQQAMGLYGAFVVHSATPGTADGVAVDAEKVLVLSEIDPAFNAAPDTFNMNDWHPTRWLINGKEFPNTPNLAVTGGERLLLRWANAGIDNNTMSLLGLHQRLLSRGGFSLKAPYDVVSQTFPSGETSDGLVTIPATPAPGAKFPVYNRNMNMGMTMFLQAP